MVAWDRRSIADCLNRRLPPPLRRFNTLLLRELLQHFPRHFAPEPHQIATILRENPIFDRIHRYCEKHNIWPTPDLISPRMTPIAAFDTLNIPQLATLSDLADWLLLTPEQLDYYADRTGRHAAHGDMAVNHYHTHLIPKSSGALRLIEAPKPRLKSMQRLILDQILAKVPPHNDTFGFVAGRNCIDGAARHAGEAMVIAFDLRDFFSNIGAGRVYGMFRCVGYPRNVAHMLTGLCTIITPARIRERMPFATRHMLRRAHLPQGAPTSPALANLVLHRLDQRLAGLARCLGGNYSRYADDLTFSGPPHMRAVLDTVPSIVREEGFALNPAKTRVMPSHRRQVVTGLVVNAKANVDRRDYDRLKAVIHAGHWRADQAEQAKLLGQIAWVNQVNPAKAARLRELLAAPRARA